MRRSATEARAGSTAAGLLLASMCLAAMGCADRQRVDVVAAASLRGPLQALADEFEAEHPDTTVRLLTGGSVGLARRLVDLDLDADLVVLADDLLFEEMLSEWSPWHVAFATDRLVLAHTQRSRGVDDLAGAGWEAVLARPEVSVAMADPDVAPVGYRTLLALRLHDLQHPGAGLERRVLESVGERHQRPNVAALLAPLQAAAVDYAFVYEATARAAGLDWIRLPADMDLGDPALADRYARVSVAVAGASREETVQRRGRPILYAATLRPGAPDPALQLLAKLLGEDGRRHLANAGLGTAGSLPRFSGRVPEAVAALAPSAVATR